MGRLLAGSGRIDVDFCARGLSDLRQSNRKTVLGATKLMLMAAEHIAAWKGGAITHSMSFPRPAGRFPREMTSHRGLGVASGTAIIVGARPVVARCPLFDYASTVDTSVSSVTTMSGRTSALIGREPQITDLMVDGISEDELVGRAWVVKPALEHSVSAANCTSAIGPEPLQLSACCTGPGRSARLFPVGGGRR